ncbi:demethoxyubiquinone hydroxylase family protein [Alphaproteobacteria bacterium]|nr:demethoxyubiquinone hydroxylase family protein [Alphaproteobacteria bacterium]
MIKPEKSIRQIIRVNHAGEFGAQKIYNGQIKFCKNRKLKEKLERISSEEKVHFDYFDEQIIKLRVRPTLMSPLWNILGTTLGVVSSRLGEDYVNACTESVEEVIVEHYKKQINFLKSQKINNELKIKIEKFCKEEDDHREDAINSKSKKSNFGLKVFKRFTKFGTKVAIEISKRV